MLEPGFAVSLDGTPFRWVVWSAAVASAAGALWCLYEAARIALGPQ